MGLAGIENLQPAGRGGDLHEPLGIGEQQVGALVRGRAPGKAQCEHFGIEHYARVLGDLGKQRLFGEGMGGKNLLLRQVDRVAQVEIVAPPGGNVLIQHLLDRL